MANILDLFLERRQKLVALADQRKKVKQATGRIRVKSRIDEVLDSRSGEVLFDDIQSADPLEFPDYAKKVELYAKRTSCAEAFICKTGSIAEQRVVCCELLADFMMGSMGSAVGEAVCRSAEFAQENQLPLIIFCASGGARMQEGMFSLMQMAKTSAAITRLQKSGGLYISVLTHPTTGGVTASFAMEGDIIIAEPGALIGFAGKRVVEQTIGAKLPEGFQSAEFQLEHGFVDLLCERAELRKTLAELLKLHTKTASFSRGSEILRTDPPKQSSPLINLPSTAPELISNSSLPSPDFTSKKEFSAQEHLELARLSSRPHIHEFIGKLFEGFIELHGDRSFGDDQSLIAGLASFEGVPVTVAGHAKGDDLNSNIARNFGMPRPEGYRKFARLVRQAEKFGRPIITFVDTPGAYPGPEAEQRGQGEAIAHCLQVLSSLRVPVVTVVTGEGGSGGALALSLADRLAMLEHSVYAVLSPEGFASILWKDSTRAAEACELMKITAADLYGFGMVDAIIAENDQLFENIHGFIRNSLSELQQLDAKTLIDQRYQRYRRF